MTLGVLEACLPVGETEELVEDSGCRERRQRLLSAAMAVRVLIAAALIPDGDTTEVMHRVAGLLELLPWARPWHAPGAGALTRRLDLIPAELFEALFWRVAGPVARPDQPGMTWLGFLVRALDAFQVAVPAPMRTGRTSGPRAPRTTPRRSRRPALSSRPRPGPAARSAWSPGRPRTARTAPPGPRNRRPARCDIRAAVVPVRTSTTVRWEKRQHKPHTTHQALNT